MNHGQPYARNPERLISQPSPPGRWRSHAVGDAQQLDTRHLMYVWGNVDRGVSDLR